MNDRDQGGKFTLNGKTYPIYGGVNPIGRNRDAVVPVANPNVSKHHSQFILVDDDLQFICDLKSSNGTFLNGNRLEPFQLYTLRDGNKVKFGDVEGCYYKCNSDCSQVQTPSNSQVVSQSFYQEATQTIGDNSSENNSYVPTPLMAQIASAIEKHHNAPTQISNPTISSYVPTQVLAQAASALEKTYQENYRNSTQSVEKTQVLPSTSSNYVSTQVLVQVASALEKTIHDNSRTESSSRTQLVSTITQDITQIVPRPSVGTDPLQISLSSVNTNSQTSQESSTQIETRPEINLQSNSNCESQTSRNSACDSLTKNIPNNNLMSLYEAETQLIETSPSISLHEMNTEVIDTNLSDNEQLEDDTDDETCQDSDVVQPLGLNKKFYEDFLCTNEKSPQGNADLNNSSTQESDRVQPVGLNREFAKNFLCTNENEANATDHEEKSSDTIITCPLSENAENSQKNELDKNDNTMNEDQNLENCEMSNSSNCIQKEDEDDSDDIHPTGKLKNLINSCLSSQISQSASFINQAESKINDNQDSDISENGFSLNESKMEDSNDSIDFLSSEKGEILSPQDNEKEMNENPASCHQERELIDADDYSNSNDSEVFLFKKVVKNKTNFNISESEESAKKSADSQRQNDGKDFDENNQNPAKVNQKKEQPISDDDENSSASEVFVFKNVSKTKVNFNISESDSNIEKSMNENADEVIIAETDSEAESEHQKQSEWSNEDESDIIPCSQTVVCNKIESFKTQTSEESFRLGLTQMMQTESQNEDKFCTIEDLYEKPEQISQNTQNDEVFLAPTQKLPHDKQCSEPVAIESQTQDDLFGKCTQKLQTSKDNSLNMLELSGDLNPSVMDRSDVDPISTQNETKSSLPKHLEPEQDNMFTPQETGIDDSFEKIRKTVDITLENSFKLPKENCAVEDILQIPSSSKINKGSKIDKAISEDPNPSTKQINLSDTDIFETQEITGSSSPKRLESELENMFATQKTDIDDSFEKMKKIIQKTPDNSFKLPQNNRDLEAILHTQRSPSTSNNNEKSENEKAITNSGTKRINVSDSDIFATQEIAGSSSPKHLESELENMFATQKTDIDDSFEKMKKIVQITPDDSFKLPENIRDLEAILQTQRSPSSKTNEKLKRDITRRLNLSETNIFETQEIADSSPTKRLESELENMFASQRVDPDDSLEKIENIVHKTVDMGSRLPENNGDLEAILLTQKISSTSETNEKSESVEANLGIIIESQLEVLFSSQAPEDKVKRPSNPLVNCLNINETIKNQCKEAVVLLENQPLGEISKRQTRSKTKIETALEVTQEKVAPKSRKTRKRTTSQSSNSDLDVPKNKRIMKKHEAGSSEGGDKKKLIENSGSEVENSLDSISESSSTEIITKNTRLRKKINTKVKENIDKEINRISENSFEDTQSEDSNETSTRSTRLRKKVKEISDMKLNRIDENPNDSADDFQQTKHEKPKPNSRITRKRKTSTTETSLTNKKIRNTKDRKAVTFEEPHHSSARREEESGGKSGEKGTEESVVVPKEKKSGKGVKKNGENKRNECIDSSENETKTTRSTRRNIIASSSSFSIDSSEMSTPTRNKRKLKPKVIFTMLEDVMLQSAIRHLGGSMVDTVQNSSVLVTKSVLRTAKLLSAVGLSKPIVSPEWITESKKENMFLEPWDFLLVDKEAEKLWNFSLKTSLERSSKKKLLEGYTFHILTNNSLDVLKAAIESCGGKIITRNIKSADKLFIIAAPENKDKYTKLVKQNANIKVIEPEAIFDGVLRQEIRFERHLLK